jgi:hypothetical protein
MAEDGASQYAQIADALERSRRVHDVHFLPLDHRRGLLPSLGVDMSRWRRLAEGSWSPLGRVIRPLPRMVSAWRWGGVRGGWTGVVRVAWDDGGWRAPP